MRREHVAEPVSPSVTEGTQLRRDVHDEASARVDVELVSVHSIERISSSVDGAPELRTRRQASAYGVTVTHDEYVLLWWLIVRRSVGVPDIVSEVNGEAAVAHRVIAALSMKASAEDQQPLEDQVIRIARGVSRAGARGGLDQLLCPFNWDSDPVAVGTGIAILTVRREAESVAESDDELIRHLIRRVAAFVHEHPFTDSAGHPFA